MVLSDDDLLVAFDIQSLCWIADIASAQIVDGFSIFSVSHPLISDILNTVGCGVVHTVLAVGDLFQRKGNIDHAVFVGTFLVEECNAIVGLYAHGAIGRTSVADFDSLVPRFGEGLRGVVIIGLIGEYLPPDSYVAATVALGQTLQGNGVDVGIFAIRTFTIESIS